MVIVAPDEYASERLDGTPIDKQPQRISWDRLRRPGRLQTLHARRSSRSITDALR